MSPGNAARETFRSLRIRNYRVFTAGQLVSLSGTWMQIVAQNWLVLKLTNSGSALGLTVGLQFLPTAVAGMWGGLIADRFDKRGVLYWTQASSGVLALALGALTTTGVVQLWMVYVLALLLGIVTLFDTPARQAFVIEMVGPEEVTNAVGLNSAVFNLGRIIGPAFAGVCIATLGLGWAFFINGITYAAVLAGLAMMRTEELFVSERLPRTGGLLREGIRFVWVTPELRSTIMLLAVVGTFGLNFMVVVPLIAKNVFDKDASGYAVMSSIMAGGAFLGALTTARRMRTGVAAIGNLAMVFGVCGVVAAIAPTFWFAAVALAFTGGASMAFISTVNSTMQLGSPPQLRGRVMAIYAIVFLGSTPIGGPLVGWISQQTSPRIGLATGAIASLAAGAGALAARTPAVRARVQAATAFVSAQNR